MSKNIDIQLNEINRLMSYNRSKTLLEQDGSLSLNFDRIYSDPETARKHVDSMDFENWTVHGVLETAELVTGLIGIIPFPPLTVVANLASMGFGLANAGVYAYEGEMYDASIALAFAMIPGGETVRLLKQIKKADGLVEEGGKLVLNKAGKEVIEQGVKKNWKKTFRESLNKFAESKGLKKTLQYASFINSKTPTPIKIYLSIIGFPIAIDTLYYLFTLAMTDDNKLTAQQQREKSQFKPIIDLFKSPTEQLALAYTIIKWVVAQLTEEDVKNIGEVDERIFENIKPIPTDDLLADLDKILAEINEKSDK